MPQLSVSSVPYGLQLAPYCDGTRARRPRGCLQDNMLAPNEDYDTPTLGLTDQCSASELIRHIGWPGSYRRRLASIPRVERGLRPLW